MRLLGAPNPFIRTSLHKRSPAVVALVVSPQTDWHRRKDNRIMKILEWLRINPPLADGIRRFGFRKWYERELIFSHVYLALAIVAFAGMLGAIEVFEEAAIWLKLLDVAFVVICGGVVFVALQGYLVALTTAESISSQAGCSACETYGRVAVVSENKRDGTVRVRCKHCSHEWHIDAS